MSVTKADESSLNLIFRDARTHHAWQPNRIDDELLQKVYDLAKMGPTSANCQPVRIVFVKSPAAKEKLKPCLDKGNIEQTMSAPATAIFAMDMAFYENLPRLFPHAKGARDSFANNPANAEKTAFRNATLQAAYFMLAARSLGLDCGPMSGFNNNKVDEAFFAGTQIKSNFLCNLGYGDPVKLYPRGPRLEFNETCRIE